MPGPGDDHFLPVIDDSIEGLGVVCARLGVRQGIQSSTALRAAMVLTYKMLYSRTAMIPSRLTATPRPLQPVITSGYCFRFVRGPGLAAALLERVQRADLL